jgi:hypothetical protein
MSHSGVRLSFVQHTNRNCLKETVLHGWGSARIFDPVTAEDSKANHGLTSLFLTKEIVGDETLIKDHFLPAESPDRC